VRLLTVVGLSADGSSLLLRDGEDAFAVDLAEVTAAQRPPPAPGGDGPPPTPPSPREIQQRIRHGETAEHIAEVSGLAVAAVDRYAGPVIAEREHQADRARAAEVDGRPVGELVAEHMTRHGEEPSAVVWDCWLTDTAKWELTARAGRQLVRLRWDSAARRVKPLDEGGRQALLLGPASEDALGAVLRPLSTPRAEPPPPPARAPEERPPLFEDVALFDDAALDQTPETEPAPEPDPAPEPEPEPEPEPVATMARPPARRGRAAVPAWDDIATQVAGRPRPRN
jgi:hypothetical protein